MWLYIGGVATGIIFTLVVIVILMIIDGGVHDVPPDPTYDPAGWKEWHEGRER